MAEIPPKQIDTTTLGQWYEIKKQLDILKAQEMQLRKAIFAHYFPDAHEGTNNYDLDGGYVLKGGRVIQRDVELASFNALKEQFREAGLNPDQLVEFKPSLKVKFYKELTEEQKQFFDQCLIIKDGSPSLAIQEKKR